ncbi:MAG TPA: hypothetical protein VMM12_15595 [Longimicrobiales bacterium]|nr:hypothetical protein [Longimicrobiales bacterium]
MPRGRGPRPWGPRRWGARRTAVLAVPAAALMLGLALSCGGGGGGEPGEEPGEETGGPEGVAPGDRVVFTCDDGYRFAARFRDDAVSLVLPYAVVDLPRADAQGRYTDGGRFLRVWGDRQARYESADGGRRRCSGVAAADPREESALLGYDYRAQGQEPGWVLEIDRDGSIRYAGDYGETILVVPVPPIRDSAGSQILHATGTPDLRIVLTPGPCSDTMSGEAFPEHVEVTVDGVVLAGCGGRLDERP